jgi:serine/threonine-protein kinase RsbT
MADEEIVVPIHSEYEIVTARHKVREVCSKLEFSSADQTLVATAVSELARNIVEYAKSGEIIIQLVNSSDRKGIVITARDQGPGIPNVELAMKDGYSTSNGLGLGLPGSRRIMDEFEITSQVGKGTTVIIKKWKN